MSAAIIFANIKLLIGYSGKPYDNLVFRISQFAFGNANGFFCWSMFQYDILVYVGTYLDTHVYMLPLELFNNQKFWLQYFWKLLNKYV